MHIKAITYHHPDFKLIPNLESFFDTIKHTYPEVKKSNIFKKEDDKTIYVYRIRSKSYSYLGLLVGVDVQDYLTGMIKKHENTLTTQENNMIHLIRERKALIKPVLIAYAERKKIKNIILDIVDNYKPDYKIYFEKEDQYHDFYKITEPKWIKNIQKEFKEKVPKSYIADGHHRMAAISQLVKANNTSPNNELQHVFCALFDFNELSILPYNRIIKILDLYSIDEIITGLKNICTIKKLDKLRSAGSKHEVIMYTKEANYYIHWNKDVIDYFKNKYKVAFDIDIFNKVILHDLFNIKDIRSNDRIQYVEGIKNIKLIKKSVTENPALLGFSFFPIKRTDFTLIADQNMVLPPKSTWFEPRIRNGIIVQELDLGK